MAKRFCGNGLALAKAVTRFSSSARTAIADTATVASHAASKLAASSGGGPTDSTSRVQKGSSTIAIVSGNTAAAFVKRRP
jgi:hypothetical protein